MIEEYKPTKEKRTEQTNSHHQPTIHSKPVMTTTTKGVTIHKVISLNFERIYWSGHRMPSRFPFNIDLTPREETMEL
jgi:hypothetical protein